MPCATNKTGALNREALEEALRREIERSRPRSSFDRRLNQPRSFLVAFVDGNKLHEINKERGYAAGGDVLIGAIAGALQDSKEVIRRWQDFVGRWGGDEFVLVLTEYWGGDDSFVALKQRIQNGIASRAERDGLLNASASVGIARYPGDGQTMEGLLEVAQERMLRDKEESSC